MASPSPLASSPRFIKRPTPLDVDGSVVLPDARRAPRKPGSPYQIVERYPGARLYTGLPE
jgi:hypothetical protein